MILTLCGLGIWIIVDFIMPCIGSFRDIDGRVISPQRALYVAPDSHANTPELSKVSELEKIMTSKTKELSRRKSSIQRGKSCLDNATIYIN